MITERYISRAVQVDADGNRQGNRTFVAIGYPNIAAVSLAFAADPLNTVHPDDPRLLYDGVSIAKNGSGAFDVVASFSSFQGGRLQRRRPTIDEPIWNRSSVRAVEDIGFNALGYITTGSGVGASSMRGWVAEVAKIEDWRPRKTVKVIISNVPSINIFDVIDEQTGKLHLLGGKLWQFVSGTTSPVSSQKYEASYTWELDKGTPMPDPAELVIGGEQRARFDFPIGADPLLGLIRKPYTKMRAIRPETFGTGIANSWVFYLTREPVIDENGWQSLPGVPNL